MSRTDQQTLAYSVTAGFREVREILDERKSSAIEPYRLDPLLPLREGRVRVWDPDHGDVVWRPWPNQEESVRSWINVTPDEDGHRLSFNNVHVEKSRQEGDTTAYAYALLWAINYWRAPLLVQHQEIDEVCDPGPTYDSIFGKIKFMYERWPPEIGRASLSFTGGNSPIIRRTDDPTAFIVGEGQTPEPGRGGRYWGGLIDEAARIRYDRQAQAALTRAIPRGRVMLSTPNGEGNTYFDLRDNPRRGWTYLRHHWTDHPIYSRGLHDAGSEPGTCVRCAATVAGLPYDPHDEDGPHRYPGRPTSPWYDDAVLELTDEQVAQELDIDYAGSLTARVFPEFDDRIHVAEEPIEWDPHLRIETGWDYGLAPTTVVICQESPLEYRVIGEVEVSDSTPERVAILVDAELRALGVSPNEFGVRDTWLNVGDPAGEARGIGTAVSLVSQYATAGFSIVSQPARIVQTINAVHRLLGGLPKPLVVSPRCENFIRHAKANRWPVDRQGNRKPDAIEPVNDEHNHILRGFAYLVHYKWPAPEPGEAIAAATRAADPDAPDDDSGRIDSGISYDMDF